MEIEKAKIEDLPEILQLQYLAYQSEARLVNDFDIPPLKQTLEEVQEEFRKGTTMNIYEFWKVILEQDAGKIRGYFHQNARVNWHCTNESFSVEEFIIANCEYPGEWDGEVERVEKLGNLYITVTQVFPKTKEYSFHVTSFILLEEGKIVSVDEYWADDGEAPLWRKDKHIGKSIK